MDTQRRLFRHGVVMLTGAFVLGIVAGASGGGPHARLWLGAHTTGILVGLMVIAFGGVWPRLTLSVRSARVAYGSIVSGNWTGFVVLGVFAPAVGFPSAISTPTLPAAPAWASAVVGLGLVVVTITTFVACGLLVYGLRPAAEARPLDGPSP